MDEGTGLIQITLPAPDGVLTLSGSTGLTFSVGDGTARDDMTFSGTTADINAALEGMVFCQPYDFNGPTTTTSHEGDQATPAWAARWPHRHDQLDLSAGERRPSQHHPVRRSSMRTTT